MASDVDENEHFKTAPNNVEVQGRQDKRKQTRLTSISISGDRSSNLLD